MKVNANFAGWRLPSIGRTLAASLMITLTLPAIASAQTPGQVHLTVGTDGEHILDLSGEGEPGGSDSFIFSFADLWAATVAGPDFTESFCCVDGCTFDWLQSGDTIRGIEIFLSEPTLDSGHIAQIVGWPIIDNIDFKTLPDREASDWRVAATDQGLQIDCPLPPEGRAWIEVRDLQGGLQAKASVRQGQPPLRVEGLAPGVYLVQCYFGTEMRRKKVCVLR
jgi:hypothetical protein